ncbi:MAG: single-stranded DNA-binding protein [Rickettsiales bacterium]|jgi:single-strand DNA-binding protein|nr:single-stranded DNA-binding protein [Rickettsiales bacterium]
MIYLNTVRLQGYLGADPVYRRLETGDEVANFSLGITERIKGEDVASWFSVSVFSNLTNIKEYLRKGTRVCITGKLKKSTFVDKNGDTQYETEILVSNFGTNLLFENKKATSDDSKS